MYYKGMLVFFISLLVGSFYCPPAYCVDYRNSGMSCEEIGGFAQSVMYQKNIGETLKEQLKGMHESLSGGNFKSTEKVLAQIIKEIYKQPHLRNLDPDIIMSVFTNDCKNQ